MKRILISLVTFLVFTGSASAESAETEARPPAEPLSVEEALAAWQKVYEVFTHPRCANCHVPADNRPRWSGPSYGLGDGEWQFHGMNINGGASRIGIETVPCMTCHGQENTDVPHGPPGAPVWALAPVEMVWWQQSSAQICEQIKDPARTGGRTLQEVADHIDHDALVRWGWDPGPGREPAPYSPEEVVSFIESWAASGAPCPAMAE